MDLLQRAEKRRLDTTIAIGLENLSAAEQFFTPIRVAKLMAKHLVPDSNLPEVVRILDPGAGSGILSAAVVQRISEVAPETRIDITAVEKDAALIPALTETLTECVAFNSNVAFSIYNQDFIYWGTEQLNLFSSNSPHAPFDLCIQNPPYSKMAAQSAESKYLKKLGIHVPNSYAAFVAIAMTLLGNRGRLTAITPRSFCNGPYFQPFRKLMLNSAHIASIHTFESRRDVFSDTGVLQESIVTTFEKGANVPNAIPVSISHSQEDAVSTRQVTYDAVVVGDIIFVPATKDDESAVEWMKHVPGRLADLPLDASTGRVVDFRNRDRLVCEPSPLTVPMVYPAHFSGGIIEHPKASVRKPQYYQCHEPNTDKCLVPGGFYVVVKRFSSKEEKRRVVAAVWGGEAVAFDNKTSFFHMQGHGMEPELATGLSMWLNSKYIDSFFRVFSGHTQVNASDLKMLPYPTASQLRNIAEENSEPDSAVRNVLEV